MLDFILPLVDALARCLICGLVYCFICRKRSRFGHQRLLCLPSCREELLRFLKMPVKQLPRRSTAGIAFRSFSQSLVSKPRAASASLRSSCLPSDSPQAIAMLVAPPAVVASAGRSWSMGDPDEATFEGPSRRPYPRRAYPRGVAPSGVLERQGLIRASGVKGQVWGLPGPATFSGWLQVPRHP